MKIGDSVKVKSDLVVDQLYGGAVFVEEMVAYLGVEAKVTEILFLVVNTNEGSYGLSIDKNQEYEFTDEMLELVKVA